MTHLLKQGTEEWLTARAQCKLGTASTIAERLSFFTPCGRMHLGTPNTQNMSHELKRYLMSYGSDNEIHGFECISKDPYLLNKYPGFELRQAGLWVFSDIGCSCDGLIYQNNNLVAIVEIKCKPPTQYRPNPVPNIKVDTYHIPQVQIQNYILSNIMNTQIESYILYWTEGNGYTLISVPYSKDYCEKVVDLLYNPPVYMTDKLKSIFDNTLEISENCVLAKWRI